MVGEFFTSGDEVWWMDAEGARPLTEDSDLVSIIIDKIREFYPSAYEALCSCYAKSVANPRYFNFLVARRFCKCNFGNLDHTKSDLDKGTFNLERISCPLQGECKHEGVICQPRMDTRLSDGEKRVMRLVCEGMSSDEIAEELYLSPNTVKRHISNSYIKWGVKSRAEFMKRANDNHIFV